MNTNTKKCRKWIKQINVDYRCVVVGGQSLAYVSSAGRNEVISIRVGVGVVVGGRDKMKEEKVDDDGRRRKSKSARLKEVAINSGSIDTLLLLHKYSTVYSGRERELAAGQRIRDKRARRRKRIMNEKPVCVTSLNSIGICWHRAADDFSQQQRINGTIHHDDTQQHQL